MAVVLLLLGAICMPALAVPPTVGPGHVHPQYPHGAAYLQQQQLSNYEQESAEVSSYYSPQTQPKQESNANPNTSSRLESLEPDSEVEILPGGIQPQQPPQQSPAQPNIPGLIPGQRVYIVHMPIPGYRPGSIGGYQPVYVVAAAPGGNPNYAQGPGGNPSYAQGPGSNPSYAQGPGGNPNYAQVAGGNPNYAQVAGGNPNYAQVAGGNPNYAQGPGGNPNYVPVAAGNPGYQLGGNPVLQGGNPNYVQGGYLQPGVQGVQGAILVDPSSGQPIYSPYLGYQRAGLQGNPGFLLRQPQFAGYNLVQDHLYGFQPIPNPNAPASPSQESHGSVRLSQLVSLHAPQQQPQANLQAASDEKGNLSSPSRVGEASEAQELKEEVDDMEELKRKAKLTPAHVLQQRRKPKA